MSQPIVAKPSSPTPKRSWRRRRLLLGVVGLFVICLGVAGYFYVVARLADRRLQAIMDELDRTDPGWRLEDLATNRKSIAEEENSAPRVAAVFKALPEGWLSADFDTLFQDLPSERALNEYQAAKLAEKLAELKPAVRAARQLKDFPNGRYHIASGPNPIAMPLSPQAIEGRSVGILLGYDAIHRAQSGDYDGAVQSCQAGVNVARSLGDEMFLISLLVRIAVRNIALHKLERVLAQGESSPALLAEFQRLLEDEETQPLLYYAARGERAFSDASIQQVRSGKGTLAGLAGPTALSKWRIGPLSLENLLAPILYGSLSENAAANLRFTTRFVEIARKTPEEQYALLAELEATVPQQPALVRLLAPAVLKVAEAFRRSTTELRCAIVMLAVERFRLEQGRWPKSLAELVGNYLPKVPVDLYDGQPLRFRRLDDRVVIYSAGLDGQDNGGNIDPSKPVTTPGTDLGFRLWDVKQRRQAPLNPGVGPPYPPSEGPDDAVPPP